MFRFSAVALFLLLVCSRSSAIAEPLSSSLLNASVKLRVDAAGTHSWGTGTIVDTRKGEALILTCGHIFRDSKGEGTIEVHLFGDNSEQRVLGRCLFYDLEIDLALITISPPCPVKAAAIAPPSFQAIENQRVISVGCDGGANPTLREHRILSTTRIGTPLNNAVPFKYIQVSGAPVSGRSGGGLFSADGYLIGVCNTADPVEDDGQFVPPEMIRLVLQKLNLAEIYERPSLQDTARETADGRQQTADGRQQTADGRRQTADSGTQHILQPAMELHPIAAEQRVAPPSTASGLNAAEQATLDEIKRRAQDGDEIILIVRSRRNPEIPSDLIVLNGTSDQFLQALKTQPLNAPPRMAADGNYNPVILSSHEPASAAGTPISRSLTDAPLSGQRPVSFPVLH